MAGPRLGPEHISTMMHNRWEPVQHANHPENQVLYTTFLQAAESVAALKTPEAVFPAVSLFFGARAVALFPDPLNHGNYRTAYRGPQGQHSTPEQLDVYHAFQGIEERVQVFLETGRIGLATDPADIAAAIAAAE